MELPHIRDVILALVIYVVLVLLEARKRGLITSLRSNILIIPGLLLAKVLVDFIFHLMGKL